MSTLGIFLLGIAALIAGFWYLGRKPAIHRGLTPEKIERLLGVLLRQGYDGGVLFVRGKRRFPFIQVMKYAGRGNVGVQLDFPKAEWSEAFLPRVSAILAEFGAQSTIGAPGYRNELQFVTADFGTDIRRAAQCVVRVAEDGFGLRLLVDGRAHFEKVSSDPTARIGF